MNYLFKCFYNLIILLILCKFYCLNNKQWKLKNKTFYIDSYNIYLYGLI